MLWRPVLELRLKLIVPFLLALTGVALAPAWAERPGDAEDLPGPLAAVERKLAAKDYSGALEDLQTLFQRRPQDPDVHNYLGFAYRKLGRFDLALTHYRQALRLDPEHLGALEYLGELHLQRGQVEEAEALLATLERLCPQGCEERDELAEALAAYGR